MLWRFSKKKKKSAVPGPVSVARAIWSGLLLLRLRSGSPSSLVRQRNPVQPVDAAAPSSFPQQGEAALDLRRRRRRRRHGFRSTDPSPPPPPLSPPLQSPSTSASSHDLRELLRIQRILGDPAATTQPPQTQQRPRAAAATAALHHLLHRAAGFTTAEATSLLRRVPNTHRLGHLLQELRGLRLPADEIKNALGSDPDGLLSMEPGEPSRLVELLDELRCRAAIKDQVLSHGVLSAAIAARRRVELLHERGLSRRDALRVISVEPRAILYSLEDVERRVEFLVGRMGFEIGWLVEYPEFLGINLDRSIIPRHNVVEYLASVGGLGDPIEMKHYVRFSRLRFYNLFVKPYPECERIFGGLVRERKDEVRRQHPVGLWKLFKPTK